MARWWDAADADSPTLESMPVGLMELDHDWVVRYLNAAAARAAGCTRADLVGRSYWDAFPANVDNEFGRVFREAVASGEPALVEAFYPEPINQWFEVQAVPTEHGLWLYFTEVTARRQIAERLGLLVQVGEALAGSLDAPTSVRTIPHLLVPALATWATIALVDPTGTLVDAGGAHLATARTPLVRRWAAASLQSAPMSSPVLRVLTTGRPLTVDGLQQPGSALDSLATGESRRLLDRLRPGTITVLPLLGRDRVLGVLTLGLDVHRQLTAPDHAAAREIAARAGLALDNARLFDQQRRLAEDLQRSMLTAPPEPDHAQIVVRYDPASKAARVGGDWYDAFVQPDGATVLVVGDVVGHDTAAAAAMGQLRAMLRGTASTGNTGPAGLLTQLDTAITQLQLDTYATVALARFEQTPEEVGRGVTRMRWSNGGHPPPVVIHADGSITDVGGWRGELMLGVQHDTPRTESVMALERGATVLLYTDGLIERRDRDLDEGLAALRAAAADLAHHPLDVLCDQLIHRLVDGDHDDDVALVAIRLHRQDRPRPDEAGPQTTPATVGPDPAGR